MSSKTKHIFLLCVCLIAVTQLIISCANIGTPDGGLYDEDPPVILRTSPKYGAVNVHPKKVTLEFDENIKLESASERIVVSPPQFEMPEIEGSGKKVTVTLMDTLKPNYTYTIDFGSSIVDNNEGNPMGEYAFTFSTGSKIDTLQVSGTLLEAENLEPIKGMLVGLYRIPDMPENADSAEADSSKDAGKTLTSALPDSVFRTMPLERIGRTDGSGHFIIKGLAEGNYRVFALSDQDQNYAYTQRSEKLAFSDRIISPYAKYETRLDTTWHDSIHWIKVDTVNYVHYYPDDIVLTAFTLINTDRHLIKWERPDPNRFSIFFTYGSDTLPRIRPINFNVNDSTFIVDASEKNDTITYWIRDSLVYDNDTLQICLDYFATDTLGMLSLTTDTLEMTPKLSRERREKMRKQEEEDWAKEYVKEQKQERKAKRAAEEAAERAAEEKERAEAEAAGKKYEKKKKQKKQKNDDDDEEIIVPPMPAKPLEVRITNTTGMAPDKNVDFTFDEPIEFLDTALVRFELKVDSLYEPAPYIFEPVEGTINRYRLYAEWEPDSTYRLTIDSAAVRSVYGRVNELVKRNIKVKGLDSFSTLFVTLTGADTCAVVQLLNSSGKVIRSERAPSGKVDFYFLQPQTYYLSMFYDRNGNGKWDPGDYDQQMQPEEVYYYPHELVLRAQWEVNQIWNPTSTPLIKQKPEKITKQKPDKKKQIQNRNAEKLAERARRKKK